MFHLGNGNLALNWDKLEDSHCPQFLYNVYDHKRYYPGEPVNINKQSLIILSRRKIG